MISKEGYTWDDLEDLEQSNKYSAIRSMSWQERTPKRSTSPASLTKRCDNSILCRDRAYMARSRLIRFRFSYTIDHKGHVPDSAMRKHHQRQASYDHSHSHSKSSHSMRLYALITRLIVPPCRIAGLSS